MSISCLHLIFLLPYPLPSFFQFSKINFFSLPLVYSLAYKIYLSCINNLNMFSRYHVTHNCIWHAILSIFNQHHIYRASICFFSANKNQTHKRNAIVPLARTVSDSCSVSQNKTWHEYFILLRGNFLLFLTASQKNTSVHNFVDHCTRYWEMWESNFRTISLLFTDRN